MVDPVGPPRQREAARCGHAIEGRPEEARVGEREVPCAKRPDLVEPEAFRPPANRLVRQARGHAFDFDSLPVKRFVEEDRVRTGGVDRMPAAEERADVVARPVSQVEIGPPSVVGDDPPRGYPVALLEDPLEGLPVPIAANVTSARETARSSETALTSEARATSPSSRS